MMPYVKDEQDARPLASAHLHCGHRPCHGCLLPTFRSTVPYLLFSNLETLKTDFFFFPLLNLAARPDLN